MKKIISLLLAVTFVACAFCMPVSATYADRSSTAYIQYGTSAHDLQAYGLHTFQSAYVTAEPALDGVISAGEYGALENADVATIGNGLTVTNNTASSDYTEAFKKEYAQTYEKIKLTSYLAYSDEYAFIAAKVESPFKFDVVTYDGTVDTLNVNVRYGLNQSDAVPEAASRLSNTYEYVENGAGYLISGCTTGNRNYKVINGTVSQSITLEDEPYADWNTVKYSKNNNIGYSNDGTTHTYIFEYKIPLADVMFSATGTRDAAQVATLLANETFYGSYLFQVAVTRTGGDNQKTQYYLTTGYAGNRELLPYSATSADAQTTTWAKAAKEYWTNEKGESLSVAYIPSPVIHKKSVAPGTSIVPPASGFRPGLTGYRLDKVATSYKLGDVAKFTVIPDAVENVNPVEGDVRVIPTKFRVRKGYDTKITGTFADDFKTAQFETKDLPVGLNTLVVTFVQQKYDGTKWVDTTITKNLSRNFTITGTVLAAATQGASQTGDSLNTILLLGGAMLVASAGISALALKKKRVK